MTRQEELELVLAAAGRDGAVKRMPRIATRAATLALRPFDPRRAAMIDFLDRICSMDMVAPPHGDRRLRDYLQSVALP